MRTNRRVGERIGHGRGRGAPLWPLALVLAALVFTSGAALASGPVTVHVFWHPDCPHCANAKQALAALAADADDVRIKAVEVGRTAEGDALFMRTLERFGVDVPAVPLVVVGDGHVVGFSRPGGTAELYGALIAACRAGPCPDVVAGLSGEAPGSAAAGEPAPVAGTLTLPIIGEVRLGDLSLPALTVVLAAVDGFNPCAMWVLALLIAFLLGVEDARRMWTLGLVFLAATGVMYFAVMAAWLNVVLWIGALSWLRMSIGALAVGAGIYYLREYWTNPEGVCRVTSPGRRRSVAAAFRDIVERPNLLLAALAVAALAIAVNLVELVCSAGVPAIYTQTLAMHDLSAGARYAYLALYLAVFLLDDVAIFATAMITLRAATATGRYARLSHLVGGVVLVALGAVMVLRPGWLA